MGPYCKAVQMALASTAAATKAAYLGTSMPPAEDVRWHVYW